MSEVIELFSTKIKERIVSDVDPDGGVSVVTTGKRYKGVIFDLDGTLLNTLDDIADTMNALLKGARFPQHPVDAFKQFVGDGADTMVRRSLPPDEVTDQLVKKMYKKFRKRYKNNWKKKTVPYDGIIPLFDTLQQAGLFLAILSNKPHNETADAVSWFFGSHRFTVCLGYGVFPRKPDPEAVEYILSTLGIRADECLYVGDTGTDMKTAAAAGVDAIGVSWGFREPKELLSNGAKWIVLHPNEILPLALNNSKVSTNT